MRFDDPDLLDALEQMTPAQYDDLDFGVIRTDAEERVVAYNRYEESASTLPRERVMGKNLFVQVAPCTNNYMVAERYRQSEALDEIVPYVFTFVTRPTPVRLRLLKRAGTGQYLVVDRS